MRCWLVGFLLGIAALELAHADEPAARQMAACFADPKAVVWCGNGLAALALNDRGQTVSLRWPGPGGPEQISCGPALTGANSKAPYPGGIVWAISTDSGPSWLASDAWKWSAPRQDDERTTIEIQGRNDTLGLSALQRIVMAVDQPVILMQLEVTGLPQAPTIYWCADFSPCCRQPAELASVDTLFAATRDFACFSEDAGRSLYHFRPNSLEQRDWDRAVGILRGEASSERKKGWAQFDKGTWIAYATTDSVSSFECGNEYSASSAFAHVRSQTLTGHPVAVGACDSAIAIGPVPKGNAFTATVMIVLAATYGEASAKLKEAASLGFERLAADAREDAIETLRSPFLTYLDQEMGRVCRRSAQTLLQCFDPSTAAIVRSPADGGLAALDWPRDGAWATLALDMIGKRDLAEAHTLFYCQSVRKTERPGAPIGSVPMALYSDGREALPRSILDAGTAAWTLGSIWRHATFLEQEARRGYLGKTWESVNLIGDFLAAWTDARTHEPFPYFDRRVLRDRTTEDGLLEVYMGIDAALRICAELGHDVPDHWTRRKQELDIQLRFRCIDDQGAWKAEAVLPYWQQEVVRTGIPSWAPTLERRVGFLESDPGADPSATVCDAALIREVGDIDVERLKPLLGRMAERVGKADALRSAQTLVAAACIYPVK